MKNYVLTLLIVFSTVCSSLAFAAHPAVGCAKEANSVGYNSDQSVLLCSGATSSAPVKCAKEANSEGYNTDQSAQLCK